MNLDQLNKNEDTYSLRSLLSDIQSKGLLNIKEIDPINADYNKLNRAEPTEIISAIYDLGKLNKPEITRCFLSSPYYQQKR